MSSARFLATVRSRLQHYLTPAVVVAWIALTVLVIAYAYIAVMPGFDREGVFKRGILFPLTLGVLGLLAGCLVLAVRFQQPRYAVGSMLLVGLAVLPLPMVCVAPGCSGVERLRVFFDWSLLGPAVSASFDAGRCAYICPYRVPVLPLGAGYALIGATIASKDE
ncbi:hypothetical protein [Haloarchaeobius sp. DFWS5]|uniref:hypothetical protein n=1 Tax=Haloarchaeobius sp. DFWS5 TaxID=3446114 RepID=UPI003EBAA0B8